MIRVILHHSLTKDGEVKDFDAIKRYHINTMKFIDIGYQYVIEMVNGEPRTFKGRSEKTDGAHTYGHNKRTIGICVVGNYDHNMPSKVILNELFKLLDDIKSRYGEIEIHGHNEYSSKTCPGKVFPLSSIKNRYKNHWAEDFYDYYNDCIGTMHEKRFNDALTRGEYLSLRCSEEQRKE